MAKDKLQDNLHWLLMRISIKSKHALIKIAESYDLTVVQVITLFILEPGKNVPMHSISGLLSCDPSNVTMIVDKLLATKHIQREESPTDRRIKEIGLTASGAAVREKILQKMVKTNVPNLAVLSQSETKALKKILLKIAPHAEGV